VRSRWGLLPVVSVVIALLVGSAVPVHAQVNPSEWRLVSLCTSFENFNANTRTFRVDNLTQSTTPIVLRNQTINQSISGNAPPGSSTWQVPASPTGANTTQLILNGTTVATKASNNRVCAVLAGNAACDPATGRTTVTWTVTNNDGSAKPITGSARGVTYSPNPVPANGSSRGTEVLAGPSTDQQLTETVTVDLGADVISRPTATVTAAACIGPEPPPVTFTFTKTASAASAMVGAVISYTYCGQNTSDVPLEVTRLVDDRLGVVIELPDVQTIVQPGDRLCNTDLNQPVTYTVRPADAGTTITNNAVVTVRDPQNPERVFQQSAQDSVTVAQLPDPPPEPSTTTTTTTPGPTTTGSSTTPGPTLPSTGSNAGSTASFAVAFLMLGVTAIAISRRPRRPGDASRDR
jgi:hypothetical protein